MAPTPFDLTLVLRPRNGGTPITLTGDADDVAGNLVTWKENSDLKFFVVPMSTGGVDLEDVLTTAGGVDTTRLQFVIDTVDKPVRLRSGSLKETLDVRNVPKGIAFAPGSQVQMKQLA